MVYCLLYYILDAIDDPDENSEKIEYFLFCFERGLGSWFLYVCLFVLRDDNNQNKMMHTSDEYIICYTTITGIF